MWQLCNAWPTLMYRAPSDRRMFMQGELDTEGCGKAICSKADELSPTAVVMAKHTKGVLHQWVIGSVCKYCTTNCKWTVVISHTA